MPSTHSSSIAFFGVYLALCILLLPVHPRVSAFLPGYSLISDPTEYSSSSPGWLGDGVMRARRPLDDDRDRSWQEIVGTGSRFIFAMTALACAGAVMWSRVRLGHHTPNQVLAGATLGCLVAAAWFFFWVGLPSPSSSRIPSLDDNTTDAGERKMVIGGLKDTGEAVERAAEDAAYVLLEAWQTRDGGLAWDGVGRPALQGLRSFVGAARHDHRPRPDPRLHGLG